MQAIAAMRCSDGQPDGKAPVQMFYLLTTMQQYLVRYALESQMSNMCLRVEEVAILIILKSPCYFILLRVLHELLVLMSPRSMVYLRQQKDVQRPSCFLTILPFGTIAGSNVDCLSFRRKCRQFIRSGKWQWTS